MPQPLNASLVGSTSDPVEGSTFAPAAAPHPAHGGAQNAVPHGDRRLGPIQIAGAALLVVGGALAAVLLANLPLPGPLAGVAIAFMAGCGAVWIVMGPEVMAARHTVKTVADDARDLRERAEQQEDAAWELRESDERHRSVIDALGDVIFRRDDAGRVVYANEAFARCFGVELTSVIGEPLTVQMDPAEAIGAEPQDTLQAHPSAQSQAQSQARPGPADFRLDTVAGPRWFSRLDVRVRDGQDGHAQVQTILRDVTPRRLAEDALVEARDQAQSASRAKSRFLATVSHEIRTPLNGILGMTGLLRDTPLNAAQDSYADAIHTSGEALMTLIDEVLDFSKVEAGKLELRSSPTNLEALIEGVVELLAPRAQAKGLEIAAYVAPDVPPEVLIDGARLRQVLINLAGNGIKFTDAGGVLIEVCVDTITPKYCRLAVCVHDTGIGIAPDKAERLFQEFEQVDHGPARRYGGTGLGLAISQRIVARMKGRIQVQSEPGLGASFSFAIDVDHSGDLGDGAADLQADLAHRRIDLIAGDGIEATLIARRLKGIGVNIRDLDPTNLDLFAVDSTSPEGEQAEGLIVDHMALEDPAGWLAGERAKGNHAPALVLITPSQRAALPALRAGGFEAYLIKPVRSRSLLRITAAMVSGKEISDAPNDWSAPSADEEVGDVVGAAPKALRLLVAEDNEINLRLTLALLQKFGHEVVVVEDGGAAIEAVEASWSEGGTPFDAVFTDLHMPQVDGLEVIRSIRAGEAARGLAPLPVFALTADVMPESRAEAESAGASGFMTKPLDPDALGDALALLT